MILSIIIPAYNSETYIENCINNIYNQKMNICDYEIVIVNDGSKDNTRFVVEQLQKKYSNVILINQINQGSSIARNTGVNCAKGDYIYFLDSDDYLAENTLSIIIDIAVKFMPDLLGFDAIRTNQSNLIKCQKNEVNVNTLSFLSGQEYLELNPEHRVEIWWYFIKRAFLINSGVTFKKGVFHQDVIFTLELFMEAKKVINLPLDVYRYYQSSGSSIRNKNPAHLKKIIDDYITLFNDMTSLGHIQIVKNLEKTEQKTLEQNSVNE